MPESKKMTIHKRSFHWNDDFELVRRFLIDCHQQSGRFDNWIPSMFENERFGPCGTEYTDEDDRAITLWEQRDVSIQSTPHLIAVTILKSYGRAILNIHPNFRYLEKQIIEDLESQRCSATKEVDTEIEISFTVRVSDTLRSDLLREMSYTNMGLEEHHRIRPVELPIPVCPLPTGFAIRHVNLPEDFPKYREVIGSVFKHCQQMTERLAQIYSEAEFYNDELDLVVAAPNGEFAAFVTVRIDPVSRMAELEPVGTHPNYRGLGLAKAVICEGLRRLQKYNPLSMTILGAAPTEGATQLYDSLGFSREDVHLWSKVLR